jgi:hypothetical protein
MLQNLLNGFRQRQLWIRLDEYYYMPAGDDQDDLERLHEQCKLFVFSAGANCFKSMLHSVKTIQDYAEALKMEFNNEIQTEHFGNSHALSI